MSLSTHLARGTAIDTTTIMMVHQPAAGLAPQWFGYVPHCRAVIAWELLKRHVCPGSAQIKVICLGKEGSVGPSQGHTRCCRVAEATSALWPAIGEPWQRAPPPLEAYSSRCQRSKAKIVEVRGVIAQQMGPVNGVPYLTALLTLLLDCTMIGLLGTTGCSTPSSPHSAGSHDSAEAESSGVMVDCPGFAS